MLAPEMETVLPSEVAVPITISCANHEQECPAIRTTGAHNSGLRPEADGPRRLPAVGTQTNTVTARAVVDACRLGEDPLAARQGECDIQLAQLTGAETNSENAVGIAGHIFTAGIVSE